MVKQHYKILTIDMTYNIVDNISEAFILSY